MGQKPHVLAPGGALPDSAQKYLAVSEEDLGACARCGWYDEFRPHQWEKTPSGERLKMHCNAACGQVLARTDIQSVEECEHPDHYKANAKGRPRGPLVGRR